jgi:hypothetical protein
MKTVNSKLETWSNDRQSLSDQMTKLGRRMAAGIGEERKQAQKSSAEMFRRVQAEINDRIQGQMQGVKMRLARLE